MKNRRQSVTTTSWMSLHKSYLLPPTALYTEQYWLPWYNVYILNFANSSGTKRRNKLGGKEGKTHLAFSAFSYSNQKLDTCQRN